MRLNNLVLFIGIVEGILRKKQRRDRKCGGEVDLKISWPKLFPAEAGNDKV